MRAANTRYREMPTDLSRNRGGKPWTVDEEGVILRRLRVLHDAGYLPTTAFWTELSIELGRTPRSITSKVAELRRKGILP